MRILIYHFPLGEMDGTSVVLRRLYGSAPDELRHVYFRDGRFPPPSEYAATLIRGFPAWPHRRGLHFVSVQWRRFMIPLLLRRSSKLQALRKELKARSAESVHVIVYDEPTAECARRTLTALSRPRFALHLMDLLHEGELTPDDARHLCWLLENARAVAVATERMARAVAPRTRSPILVWPNMSGFPATSRSQPSADQPWRVLFSGALYSGKAAFLEGVFLPAWKQFRESRPHAELVYMGKDERGLPPAVRACTRVLGLLPSEQVAPTLRSAAVGLLPVLHESSTPWRYSVPARVSDYLAAGLPTLAPRSEGTATHDFFEMIGAPAIAFAGTADDVLRALTRLHDNPGEWLAASRAATEFARKNLDFEKLRAELFAFIA